MKTQATKRKLTLKTQKAQPASDAEGKADGADTTPPAAAPVAAAPTGKAVVDTSYHKPALIMAILAALVFLALIAVQALEWYYYQQPPSVWPPKVAGTAAP